MAAVERPVEGVAEDEAAERLLQNNQVVVVPSKRRDDGLLSAKSSKKVTLPEDGVSGVAGGRFTIGPAPERDWELVPPDGNWGWFVLVGATLVNILIPGTIKSFGVLMVEFSDVFSASAAANSGVVALCYFLYSSLGPLSSILSVRWSYRTVVLMGGSLAAGGMILSFWANSITYLYFSFGALVGSGAGLAFPPTVYIVTSYFVRLRGLANGICMSGSAFGSIILPPLLRLLLETYGYQGTVLVLGGIMLNVWAAALLFQPVELHLVRKALPTSRDQQQDDILVEEDETVEVVEMEIEKLENGRNSPPKLSQELDKHAIRSSSQHLSRNNSQSITKAPSQSQLKHNLSKRKLSYTKPIPKTNYSSVSIALEGLDKKLGSQEMFNRRLSSAGPKRNMSTSSFAYISSTPFHGSTLTAFEQPNEFASQFSIKSISESISDVAYCCFCCKIKKDKKEANKFFDVNLLTDPTYLVILVSSSTVAISCTNFIIQLPSHAHNIGFDKSKGALLLSTVSALDLVGRIGGSALCDLNLMPKTFYFVGGLLFSGIALAIIPFLKSYTAISVFCAFFGLASGINNSVTTLVMAEILGVERLMSTYGISLFVNGILQLVGPPICGIWYEHDKNFKNMFVTFGLIFIGGASLWLLMPAINRRKRRLLAEKENKPQKV